MTSVPEKSRISKISTRKTHMNLYTNVFVSNSQLQSLLIAQIIRFLSNTDRKQVLFFNLLQLKCIYIYLYIYFFAILALQKIALSFISFQFAQNQFFSPDLNMAELGQRCCSTMQQIMNFMSIHCPKKTQKLEESHFYD